MNNLAHQPAKMGDLAAHVDQLPMLPTVIMRVLQLDSRNDRYFDQLVRLAEEDPTFAVRLIRVANSPMSAPSKPIATVRQAVIRIGARESAGLATAMAVARVFVPRTQGQKNLWVHALQTAVAARTIAGLTIDGGVAPDQAYLAGLLHDIGRFVMFEGAEEDLRRVDDANWNTPQQLLIAEHELLGYDHVRLGILICKRWSLPKMVADTVQWHHDYFVSESGPDSVNTKLIQVVQMADLLSVRLMSTPSMIDEEPDQITADLARSCVRPEWHRAPLSPSVLSQQVAAIANDAAALTKGLFGAE